MTTTTTTKEMETQQKDGNDNNPTSSVLNKSSEPSTPTTERTSVSIRECSLLSFEDDSEEVVEEVVEELLVANDNNNVNDNDNDNNNTAADDDDEKNNYRGNNGYRHSHPTSRRRRQRPRRCCSLDRDCDIILNGMTTSGVEGGAEGGGVGVNVGFGRPMPGRRGVRKSVSFGSTRTIPIQKNVDKKNKKKVWYSQSELDYIAIKNHIFADQVETKMMKMKNKNNKNKINNNNNNNNNRNNSDNKNKTNDDDNGDGHINNDIGSSHEFIENKKKSTRGLEYLLSNDETTQKRMYLQIKSRKAVMYEQNRQKQLGISNPKLIQDIYTMNGAEKLQQVATNFGLHDQVIAGTIRDENENNKKKNLIQKLLG